MARDNSSGFNIKNSPGSWIIIFVILPFIVGMNDFGVIPFNIFSKFEICIYIILFSLPIGMLVFMRNQKWVERKFSGINLAQMRWAFVITFPLLAIMILLIVNQYADLSSGEKTSFTVASIGSEPLGKGRYYYHIDIIASQSFALPSYLPQSYTIEISLDQFKKIAVGTTQITLITHKGFLGFSWYEDSIEITQHAFPQRVENNPEPKSQPVPYDSRPTQEEIQDACSWNLRFVTSNEIEDIKPDGYLRDFWPNGTPRSVEPTVNGKRNGIGHYTFANGKLYADIPWKQGKKHGVFTLYRDNGTREQVLSYRQGQPYGISEWYDSAGNVLRSTLYLKAGQLREASICPHH
jgi:hypothetical protein